MYYEYFGFKQPPFRITPDTSLFYPGGERGAILDALVYAIVNGEGIVKVVGEVGSGKTMLCRMLEKELPDRVEVVYLVNPSIAPENTLHAIAFELKLDVNSSTSRFEVMNALQQYLLQRHSENRQVVVFVEEAQSMPIATLEEIRLLSNLETQQSKLLQIVLFGQPELDVMIASPEIRQLKERITYSFQLAPFKTNDIREYINTRIRACGYRAGELFTDTAIRQIEQYSKGLLRRINILADKSLLAAFADNAHKVDIRHTHMAARDSEFLPRPSSWSAKKMLVLGTIAGVLLISTAILLRTFILSDTPATRTEELAGPEAPGTETVTNDPATDPVIRPEPSAAVVTRPVPPDALDPEPADTAVQPEMETAAPPLPAEDVQPVMQQTGSPENTVALSADPVADPGTVPPQTGATPTISTDQMTPDIDNNNSVLSKEIEENNPFLDENSVDSDPVETGDNQQSSPENQLLGMSSVYELQDVGNSNLSDSEATEMQSQLLRLPPESAENPNPPQESDICRLCWSIIYRPLPITKNL